VLEGQEARARDANGERGCPQFRYEQKKANVPLVYRRSRAVSGGGGAPGAER
jgi:hypothetical protein